MGQRRVATLWNGYINSTAPDLVALVASIATLGGLGWTIYQVYRVKSAARAAEAAATSASNRFGEVRMTSVVERLGRAVGMLDMAVHSDNADVARLAIEEWERSAPELVAMLESISNHDAVLRAAITESKRLCSVAAGGLNGLGSVGFKTRSLRREMSNVVDQARVAVTRSQLDTEPLAAISREIPS